jgi:formylmethanofuran dehydrogenase subunit E
MLKRFLRRLFLRVEAYFPERRCCDYCGEPMPRAYALTTGGNCVCRWCCENNGLGVT